MCFYKNPNKTRREFKVHKMVLYERKNEQNKYINLIRLWLQTH